MDMLIQHLLLALTITVKIMRPTSMPKSYLTIEFNVLICNLIIPLFIFISKKGSRFLEFYVCTKIIKNMHNEYNQRYLTLLHSSTDLCNNSVQLFKHFLNFI